MKRIGHSSGKLSRGRRAHAVIVLCAITAVTIPAQTFTTLHSFDGTDGSQSHAALVQATNGDFYGTARDGGANGGGTIFAITPSGTLTLLYSFCAQSGCTDGEAPFAALVQGTDGDFYGTTEFGGAHCSQAACGTVFKITPSGTLTTLYSFCAQNECTDGGGPNAGLVQGANGDFYGTTESGGTNCFPYGCGTVFKITPSGALTTLYSFCAESECADGETAVAGLVLATDGNLYGTTAYGGANACPPYPGCGTIFKITTSGTLTTLYSFCAQGGCADGDQPYAGLVQASNGDFYGTTDYGGAYAVSAATGGTVFKITPTGTLTTLYSFCAQSGCADGDGPNGLVQATNGDFYGTTGIGGVVGPDSPTGGGTVFKVTPSGELTTLYSFCAQDRCTYGETSGAGLLQATNGNFYGTTEFGGASFNCAGGCGTVFSLSVNLGPFVETQPTSGKVGAGVKILGTNLAGVSRVTFNGTPAAFGVFSNSQTEITAMVPAGATSGTVQVVTPSGTLSSNVPFLVRP